MWTCQSINKALSPWLWDDVGAAHLSKRQWLSLAADELLERDQSFGRRRKRAADDFLQLLAACRRDLEAALLRIGAKLGIGDHLVERLPEHGNGIRRHIGRRHHAPADAGVGILEFEDAAAFI